MKQLRAWRDDCQTRPPLPAFHFRICDTAKHGVGTVLTVLVIWTAQGEPVDTKTTFLRLRPVVGNRVSEGVYVTDPSPSVLARSIDVSATTGCLEHASAIVELARLATDIMKSVVCGVEPDGADGA